MNNFYIYKFTYKENRDANQDISISATVIFCDRNEIQEENLKDEIRTFYESNYQTDKIFVIGGSYQKERLIE